MVDCRERLQQLQGPAHFQLADLLASKGDQTPKERQDGIIETYTKTVALLVANELTIDSSLAALFYQLSLAAKDGNASEVKLTAKERRGIDKVLAARSDEEREKLQMACDLHIGGLRLHQLKTGIQEIRAVPEGLRSTRLAEEAEEVFNKATLDLYKSPVFQQALGKSLVAELLLSRADLEEAACKGRLSESLISGMLDVYNKAFKLDRTNFRINQRRCQAHLYRGDLMAAASDIQLAKRSASKRQANDEATMNDLKRLEDAVNARRAAAKAKSPSPPRGPRLPAKTKLSPMRGGFLNQNKQPSPAVQPAAARGSSQNPSLPVPTPVAYLPTLEETLKQKLNGIAGGSCSTADVAEVERMLASARLRAAAEEKARAPDGKAARTSPEEPIRSLWKELDSEEFVCAVLSTSPAKPSVSMGSSERAATKSAGVQELQGAAGPSFGAQPSSGAQPCLPPKADAPADKPTPGAGGTVTLEQALGLGGKQTPEERFAVLTALLENLGLDTGGLDLVEEGDLMNSGAATLEGISLHVLRSGTLEQKASAFANLASLHLSLDSAAEQSSFTKGKRRSGERLAFAKRPTSAPSGLESRLDSYPVPTVPRKRFGQEDFGHNSGIPDSDESDSDAEGPLPEAISARQTQNATYWGSEADDTFQDSIEDWNAEDFAELEMLQQKQLEESDDDEMAQLRTMKDPSELNERDEEGFASAQQSNSSGAHYSLTDANGPAPEWMSRRDTRWRESRVWRDCMAGVEEPDLEDLEGDQLREHLSHKLDGSISGGEEKATQQSPSTPSLNDVSDSDFVGPASPEEAAQGFRLQGNQAFSCGKYEEAAECFLNAVELYDHPALYTCLAAAYVQLKDYEGAFEAASRAMDVHVLCGDAYWWRAQTFLAAGHFERAHQDLLCVMLIYNRDPANYTKYRTAFNELHRLERSTEYRRCKFEMVQELRRQDEQEQKKAPQTLDRVLDDLPASKDYNLDSLDYQLRDTLLRLRQPQGRRNDKDRDMHKSAAMQQQETRLEQQKRKLLSKLSTYKGLESLD